MEDRFRMNLKKTNLKCVFMCKIHLKQYNYYTTLNLHKKNGVNFDNLQPPCINNKGFLKQEHDINYL